MATQYPVGRYIQQMGTLLGVSPERALRHVGLSTSVSDQADRSESADTCFRIRETMIVETDRPGVEMDLAMANAHGPFLPPIFAFSRADTLALGLRRFADFKPLIGPIKIDVSRLCRSLQGRAQPARWSRVQRRCHDYEQ